MFYACVFGTHWRACQKQKSIMLIIFISLRGLCCHRSKYVGSSTGKSYIDKILVSPLIKTIRINSHRSPSQPSSPGFSQSYYPSAPLIYSSICTNSPKNSLASQLSHSMTLNYAGSTFVKAQAMASSSSIRHRKFMNQFMNLRRWDRAILCWI